MDKNTEGTVRVYDYIEIVERLLEKAKKKTLTDKEKRALIKLVEWGGGFTCSECGGELEQTYVNRWTCKQCNRDWWASELM